MTAIKSSNVESAIPANPTLSQNTRRFFGGTCTIAARNSAAFQDADHAVDLTEAPVLRKADERRVEVLASRFARLGRFDP